MYYQYANWYNRQTDYWSYGGGLSSPCCLVVEEENAANDEQEDHEEQQPIVGGERLTGSVVANERSAAWIDMVEKKNGEWLASRHFRALADLP